MVSQGRRFTSYKSGAGNEPLRSSIRTFQKTKGKVTKISTITTTCASTMLLARVEHGAETQQTFDPTEGVNPWRFLRLAWADRHSFEQFPDNGG
jgi:hypothetical protein